MKNTVTAVVDVDATVEEAYAYWRRSHNASPIRGEPANPAASIPWVVRVNGVRDDAAPVHAGSAEFGRLFTWSSAEEGSPTGEVTFEQLADGQTRVMISLEWQRPDSGESYIPLIFVDGVQVNADLRNFKRDLENEARESLGWEQTLDRFESF